MSQKPFFTIISDHLVNKIEKKYLHLPKGIQIMWTSVLEGRLWAGTSPRMIKIQLKTSKIMGYVQNARNNVVIVFTEMRHKGLTGRICYCPVAAMDTPASNTNNDWIIYQTYICIEEVFCLAAAAAKVKYFT